MALEPFTQAEMVLRTKFEALLMVLGTKHRLNQSQCAAEIRVTQGHFNKVVKGRKPVTPQLLRSLELLKENLSLKASENPEVAIENRVAKLEERREALEKTVEMLIHVVHPIENPAVKIPLSGSDKAKASLPRLLRKPTKEK